MRTIVLVAFLASFAAASLLAVGALVAGDANQPVPDQSLGLSKTSVFDTPVPEAALPNTTDPGDRPPIARDFPQQPPRIPHGIADFLPITADENACIDCHAVAEKEPGEPTPIPPSHYEDLRNAPGERGEHIVGARYVCVTCHISPGGNPPAVDNTFGE